MGLPGFTADVVFWAWWGGDSSDGETWRHIDLYVLLFEDDRELSELEVMVGYIRSCTLTQSSYPAVCTTAQLKNPSSAAGCTVLPGSGIDPVAICRVL